MPFIGRFAKFVNLMVGTSHAIQRLSQVPMTGKLLAGMLSGEAMTMDISLLSPAMYG